MFRRTANLGVVLLLLGGVFNAAPVAAQTVTGTVWEGSGSAAIPGAVVRLLSRDLTVLATTLTDSVGGYVLSAPDPGEFKISAERLGFFPFESPLLRLPNADGVYAADLSMELDPVELQGLTVRAEQRSEIEGGLRRAVGVSLQALAKPLIAREELVDHVVQSHDLLDLMRWSGRGVQIREEADGPCFLLRGFYCLPVYLDGHRLPQNIVDILQIDMLEYVVVLTPNESVLYPGGGVMLYTFRWLWETR